MEPVGAGAAGEVEGWRGAMGGGGGGAGGEGFRFRCTVVVESRRNDEVRAMRCVFWLVPGSDFCVVVFLSHALVW